MASFRRSADVRAMEPGGNTMRISILLVMVALVLPLGCSRDESQEAAKAIQDATEETADAAGGMAESAAKAAKEATEGATAGMAEE
jgi:hypothetical protein